MAGAVIKPQQVTRTVDMSAGQTPSMSHMNSFRISAVVDRLLVYARGGSRNDSNEFFNLCISLSRGIDYAIANNEISVKAPELPGLLKQVCQWNNDTQLKAAIMVLLISLKSACRNGWFNEKDKEELQNLSIEISSSFCSVKDMNSGEKENTFHHTISAVMLRFYPSMKMGETLAFVEAMPGYGTFVKDFDITPKAKSSNDKIYLFVAHMDDTETSSCIISPQKANFLLNGRAVDGRNLVNKDSGPQTPTVVTHMLKSGTNLLQVVGEFNGKYIIVVAFMSVIPNPSCPILPYYVPPAAAAPDSEIIEGPSRISLNCPISFKRIKTPIKGQLCKHPQCFDYDNYVDINSRRPSWRCPHCSQSVCFTDIRIDRIMVKVLKEVGVNVSHVKISADGSWEAVNEDDDQLDKPQSNPPSHQQPTSSQAPDIMDLTECDNYINATPSHHDLDIKPSIAQLQNLPNPNNQTPTPTSANLINTPPPHMENKIQNVTSNTAVPPVPNAVSYGQSQICHPDNINRRYPKHTRRVTRIPIGVQALPAQTSVGGKPFNEFHITLHQDMRIVPQKHMRPQEFGGGYQYPLDQYNSHQQQSVGPTTGYVNNQHSHHYAMSAAQHAARNGFVNINNQQDHHYAMSASQQGVQVSSWTPSGPHMHMSSLQDHGGQAPRVLEGSSATSADQSWRPSGRMRGSLSGQAYEDAVNRFMYIPTQPIQAARPPLLNTPRPVMPPHLQRLMAMSRNINRNKYSVFDGTNGGGGGGGYGGFR